MNFVGLVYVVHHVCFVQLFEYCQAVNTRLCEYNVSLNVYQPQASRLLSDAGSKRPLIFSTDVEELPAVA
jgi:hypothetical protein